MLETWDGQRRAGRGTSSVCVCRRRGSVTDFVCRSTCARAESRHCCAPTERDRSQHGFVLMTVLLALVLVTVATMSIIGFLMVNQRVVDSSANGTRRFRDIDGALEETVNLLRSRSDLAGATGVLCEDLSALPGYKGFTASCSSPVMNNPDPALNRPNPNENYRVLDVEILDGSSPIGRARVRVDDRVPGGTSLLVGYRLQVCDWQIGQALAGPMNECPT